MSYSLPYHKVIHWDEPKGKGPVLIDMRLSMGTQCFDADNNGEMRFDITFANRFFMNGTNEQIGSFIAEQTALITFDFQPKPAKGYIAAVIKRAWDNINAEFLNHLSVTALKESHLPQPPLKELLRLAREVELCAKQQGLIQ